jgi:hypothetical protein
MQAILAERWISGDKGGLEYYRACTEKSGALFRGEPARRKFKHGLPTRRPSGAAPVTGRYLAPGLVDHKIVRIMISTELPCAIGGRVLALRSAQEIRPARCGPQTKKRRAHGERAVSWVVAPDFGEDESGMFRL